MAKTQIADIIQPKPLFRDSVVERTAAVSRFFAAGIVEVDLELSSFASGKGSVYDLPFWQDLTGDSEELSDSGSLTPGKITQAKERAVKHMRGRAWSANDLAKALAGDDPMDAVVDLVADYWARQLQSIILLPSLKGLFATALASTHVHDVAIDAGNSAADANKIGSEAVIEAAGKLGDRWDRVTGMAMHSVPFRRLQNLNLIEPEHLQDQGITINRFLGREVVVDDGMPADAAPTNGFKYTTYLFGMGSIGFGEGGAPSLEDDEAVETDRDSLAGDDIFVSRRHFILHPRGVQFSGTPAGATPTKTELENGGNWTKAWEDKNIRMVKLVTNG